MELRLKSILFLCAFLLTASIYANEAPKWKGLFWRGSKSIVKEIHGSGIKPEYAKKDAEIELEKLISGHLKIDCKIKDFRLHSCDNGEFGGTVAFDILYESDPVVTIYEDDGPKNKYTIYLLVQVPNDTGQKEMYDHVDIFEEYGFSGRVFVPGMAQIYKGQNLKGALFIAGEALFIGGIAASFGISSHYKDRHDNETNTERRSKYGDRANAAYYTGWTFVGLAAALYLANIIDGAVAQGKTALFRIETDEKGKEIGREKIKFVFAPTTTFDSIGLAMNLNF